MFESKILNEIFSERDDSLIVAINNDDCQKINWLRREKIEDYKNLMTINVLKLIYFSSFDNQIVFLTTQVWFIYSTS